MSVDVIVIYTHERTWVRRLLKDLERQAEASPLRVVLVDNGAPEDTERLLSAYRFDWVRVCNQRRLGYAANINRAARQSDAEFVLAMNTDMWFNDQEPCIARMVGFLRNHPRLGGAGCRLYRQDGSNGRAARRFPTPAMIAARRLPWGGGMRSFENRYLYFDQPEGVSFQCDWVSGCCLMFRRKAYAAVGGWDEGYGKYFEDVDFCRRLWSAGWAVGHCGETYCYHEEQRASANWRSRELAMHLRSYARHLSLWGWRALYGLRPTTTHDPLEWPLQAVSNTVRIETAPPAASWEDADPCPQGCPRKD